MTDKRSGIYFGALADPLTKQLKGKLPHWFLKSCDVLAGSIVRLHLAGVISDSEAHRARRRLVKRLEKEWKKGSKP